MNRWDRRDRKRASAHKAKGGRDTNPDNRCWKTYRRTQYRPR